MNYPNFGKLNQKNCDRPYVAYYREKNLVTKNIKNLSQ